jgi:tetratricopeptide (TPR) repeat protein
MQIALEKISWDKALKALDERYQDDKQWKWKHLEANASSLSALFINDFSEAARRISRAMEIEPFNPLHRYRLALLYMRFAQWDEALYVLDELVALLPGFSYPLYLRALIYLRTGQFKRAANVANDIKTNKPGFNWTCFLAVDAQIRQKLKGAEELFRELPKGDEYSGVWIDLLVKTIVMYSSQGIKLVSGFLKRSKLLSKDSWEEKFINQVVNWSTAASNQMKEYLVRITPGSKTEQFVLLFFHDSLKNKTEKVAYINELKHLYEMFPNRSAIRRMYITTLNRYAVEEASNGKYRSALAAVEICLRLEPFHMIHYQNRATIFTLLREKKAYHRAWEELDRQHYRLALLGSIDRRSTRLLAKRHRLFSQQARLIPKTYDAKDNVQLGIFREEQTARHGVKETILAVNQQRINSDPELLRQWIHHRKAELFFLHLGMGMEPDLFLLGYTDEDSAKIKLKGLVCLGQSLAILAGEEGRLMVQLIESQWRESIKKSSCIYSSGREENPGVRFLKKNHIETLGDLAMLCYCWQPRGCDYEIVDETVEFIEAEIPFLDGQTLFGSTEKQEEKESYSIVYLRQAVIEALDIEKTKAEFSIPEQRKIGKCLTDYLFLHLSLNVFEEFKIKPQDAVRRSLKVLERARGEIPDNPSIEYYAARFFYIGDFYEEARKAIIRFHKINKNDESPLIASIEEIQNALDKAEKKDQKEYVAYRGGIHQPDYRSSDEQLMHYMEELERCPASMQTYEDLTHFLVSEGRFEEAREWSERAIGRCLSRKGQLKARMLNIEILGLKLLGIKYLDEIKLYLTGVSTPLKDVIKQMPNEDKRRYELVYLIGICFLLEGEPGEAGNVFQEAIRNCEKQIHSSALRVLSSDVEQAFYTMANESIEQFILKRCYDKAFEYIGRIMQKLKEPGLLLIDLAAVQLAALVANITSGSGIPRIPSITVNTPWNDKLLEAMNEPDELEKARRIALLAIEVHPPSKNRGEEIVKQIDGLKIQLDIASVLTLSGKYLQEGKLQEALNILDSLGEAGEREPRVLRQRAMLLLKSNEFEQADQATAVLETFEDPLAKAFVNRYPSLKSWQKINIVQQLLRKGKASEALEILDTIKTSADDEQLETAYCYAFALSVQGYQARSEGNPNDAVRLFNHALDRLEPQIEMARKSNHSGCLELYEKIGKILNDLQEESNGYEPSQLEAS